MARPGASIPPHSLQRRGMEWAALGLAAVACLQAAGSCSPGNPGVPARPSISGFAATHPAVPAGSATTLVPTFSGGSGRVEPGIGPVASGEAVSTGALTQATTYTLAVTGAAGDSASAQVTVQLLPDTSVMTFTTVGASFAPVIAVEGTPAILWTFADGTTSSSPAPAVSYGSAATRLASLRVTPWKALRRINLGYDGGDGGSPAIELVPDQHVSAVSGLELVAPTLEQWCSSYNDLTSLDFGNFTSLDTIEAFHSRTLTQVNLANTPRLSRACFEDCHLAALDVSRSPRLADLRGALNAFPSVGFGSGTFPEAWHLCIRDNPQIADPGLFATTAPFPNLAELLIWNSGQSGELRIPSTHPSADVSIQAAGNRYDALLLAGALRNRGATGLVDLADNRLVHVDLAGCVQLTELHLQNNPLGVAELDAILATVDALGRARSSAAEALVIDLTGSTSPSAAGRAHAVRLAARGWTVRAAAWTEAPP